MQRSRLHNDSAESLGAWSIFGPFFSLNYDSCRPLGAQSPFTMGQKQVVLRQRVREWLSKQANERVQRSVQAKPAERRKGMSKQMNRWASFPVITSRFMALLNHSALLAWVSYFPCSSFYNSPVRRVTFSHAQMSQTNDMQVSTSIPALQQL